MCQQNDPNNPRVRDHSDDGGAQSRQTGERERRQEESSGPASDDGQLPSKDASRDVSRNNTHER